MLLGFVSGCSPTHVEYTTEELAGVQYQVGQAWHREAKGRGTWYELHNGSVYVGKYPVDLELQTYSRQFLADFHVHYVRSLCTDYDEVDHRTVLAGEYRTFEYNYTATLRKVPAIGRTRFVYVDGNEVELTFLIPADAVKDLEPTVNAFFDSIRVSAEPDSGAELGPRVDAQSEAGVLVGTWRAVGALGPDGQSSMPMSPEETELLETISLTLYDDYHYLYAVVASEMEAHGEWGTGEGRQ